MHKVASMLVLVLGMNWSAHSADSVWLDIEGRIQYGYYTEDIRALENLADSLGGGASADATRSYYLALASYRLTLLSAARNRDQAKASAERCVASLNDALSIQNDAPEVLALQSACRGLLAGLKPLVAPFAGARSNAQMRRAVQLAPKNPRVLLLDALEDYERPPAFGGDKARAFAKLQKAVTAFELERQGVERAPGWGAAEAYAFLGRSYLDRGDAIAARGALEHALLMVPDFAFAHRLMLNITSG
jgi:tetratricopeptide (TPR) repeat protein